MVKTKSWSVASIEGDVKVWAVIRGERAEGATYYCAGVDNKGNMRRAIDNMRYNAIYKYMYDYGYASNTRFETSILSYDVFERKSLHEESVIREIYERTLKSGEKKEYYRLRDKATGRFTGGGVYEEVDYDIDALIDEDEHDYY